MEMTRQQRIRLGLISVLILGVLVAQTVSSFRRTYKWWPFLSYPMYADAHYENERILVHYSLYAVTSDGKRHYLDPDTDMKIGFWRYLKLSRQLADKVLEPAIPSLAAIKTLYPDLQEIQVEDFPMIITRDGPAKAPRKILNTIPRATIDELTK
jgi:hypothetical protein